MPWFGHRGEEIVMNVFHISIAIESFSFLLCLLLLIYSLLQKRKSASNYWYLGLIITTMTLLFTDVLNWIFDGKPGKTANIIMWTSCVLFFMATGALMVVLMGYIYSIVKKNEGCNPAHWFMIVPGLVGLFQIIISVSTIFTGHIFTINSSNSYVRESFFFLTQTPFIIYPISLYFIHKYRNFTTKKERVNLILFITVPIMGEILQLFTFGFATLAPTISLSLVLVFAFIQAEEPLLKTETENELIRLKNEKLESEQNYQEMLVEQVIATLGNSVEAKDVYTRGHSQRVANYSKEIAYRMGYSEEKQLEVYYTGLLHDIGKIRIPDGIINKKSRLTDEEFEMIKLHPVAGYHILKEVTAMPTLYQGARWHHERYDGNGYPNGLTGEEIPEIARIISVADTYDAMTSNRSYNNTMPQEKARSEIEKGMGTQFDPEIAKHMLDMIDEDIYYQMRQINENKETNILLIDDDDMVHRFVGLALQNEKYILNGVHSGEEGIRIIENEDVDLCLLDMEMPGMSGKDVLIWIRNNKPFLKVVILSGNKDLKTILEMEDLGAEDYITKPVTIGILKETIANILHY